MDKDKTVKDINDLIDEMEEIVKVQQKTCCGITAFLVLMTIVLSGFIYFVVF